MFFNWYLNFVQSLLLNYKAISGNLEVKLYATTKKIYDILISLINLNKSTVYAICGRSGSKSLKLNRFRLISYIVQTCLAVA